MGAPRSDTRDDYLSRSREPLHILVFLAPLILAYEVGAALFLSGSDGGVAKDIRAHRLLADVFEAFGVGGFYLPGILIVVVLMVWQLISRRAWRVRGTTLVGMLLESMVWTMPLLVLAQLIAGRAEAGVALAESGSLDDLSLAARATIAIGAGLYEELLFRLVLIALAHLLLADVLGIPDRWADALAVVAAAVAFALYHEDPSNFLFYATAGLFFGGIFILRGLGIVVATHAIYDLVVLVL
jgi:membrane protease YdiL (CAAX protease family)